MKLDKDGSNSKRNYQSMTVVSFVLVLRSQLKMAASLKSSISSRRSSFNSLYKFNYPKICYFMMIFYLYLRANVSGKGNCAIRQMESHLNCLFYSQFKVKLVSAPLIWRFAFLGCFFSLSFNLMMTIERSLMIVSFNSLYKLTYPYWLIST